MKKTIKILSIITCVAIMLSLAACRSSSASTVALAGTWENREFGTSYVFNEDETGTLNDEDYSVEFTYKDKGKSVDITYTGSSEVKNIEYTIKGNILTLGGIEYKKK